MREPAHTCPIIDNCVRVFENIQDHLTENEDDPQTGLDFDFISQLIQDGLSILEDIRSANSELREWGTQAHQNAKDEWEQELIDARDEIAELENTINSLENDLYNCQNQL